jgi:hypothetical protein
MRGLVMYYTLFVIELHSRRVHLVGSTPAPDEAFMLQSARHLTDATTACFVGDASSSATETGSGGPRFGTYSRRPAFT